MTIDLLPIAKDSYYVGFGSLSVSFGGIPFIIKPVFDLLANLIVNTVAKGPLTGLIRDQTRPVINKELAKVFPMTVDLPF